jgi:hypothetical protein
LRGQVKEVVGDRQAFVGIEGEVSVLVVLVGGGLAFASGARLKKDAFLPKDGVSSQLIP